MTQGTRGFLLAATLLSTLFLPWIVPAVASLALALWIPLAPAAVGLLLDALYYTPHAAWVPWGTVLGLGAAIAALLVRKRLAARIIT